MAKTHTTPPEPARNMTDREVRECLRMLVSRVAMLVGVEGQR